MLLNCQRMQNHMLWFLCKVRVGYQAEYGTYIMYQNEDPRNREQIPRDFPFQGENHIFFKKDVI